ncbi:short-chain dehydrogenase [Pseudomonas sp. R5(2019)]|uniref:short-chain dehydrogenase n=1 Tax=Pseudomonas sp. R5(2019) TaxID=2697566 RepID=UPI0014131EFD|nr:short-chain dehydrogenase [Pseudomonas sp. R5(2019)]NBA97500.1 short-chain dehydrogenase [Pseudomonas sp. R5(2019)]
MPQYIALTNNCDLPCLAIDSHAPLADLHHNALLRIRIATQLLESLARNELMSADGTDLQYVSQATAVLMRDGCDLLDVLGRNLPRDRDTTG